MINSFNYYLNSGKAKKQTPNPEESSSLINKALLRIKFTKAKMPDEETAQFVLEDAYEAAREAAQSLMAKKGYKPYSHEATVSFLKDFFSDRFSEDEITTLDRFRQLRNDSVYKATIVSVADAKECISFAEKFVEKVKKL
ncbi:MAG: HEPN domain-containing protein [archaeon]